VPGLFSFGTDRNLATRLPKPCPQLAQSERSCHRPMHKHFLIFIPLNIEYDILILHTKYSKFRLHQMIIECTILNIYGEIASDRIVWVGRSVGDSHPASPLDEISDWPPGGARVENPEDVTVEKEAPRTSKSQGAFCTGSRTWKPGSNLTRSIHAKNRRSSFRFVHVPRVPKARERGDASVSRREGVPRKNRCLPFQFLPFSGKK